MTKRGCGRNPARAFEAESAAAGSPATAALPFESRLDARALGSKILKESDGSPVKPRRLDPTRRYRIHELNLPPGEASKLVKDDQIIEGAALMREGLDVPCRQPFTSAVIELAREPR